MPPQKPIQPNQQFDLISETNQPAKKGLGLTAPNLPKPLMMGAIAAVALIVIFTIVGLVSSSGNSNGNAYFAVQARAQEITRVSQEVEGLSNDPNTQNLASTVNNVLSGGQKQLKDYMKSAGTNTASEDINSDKNAATDTQMQTADTNNNLDTVFAAYLTTQLAEYQNDLQAAYSIAGPHGKAILSNINASVKTIISTLPPSPSS